MLWENAARMMFPCGLLVNQERVVSPPLPPQLCGCIGKSFMFLRKVFPSREFLPHLTRLCTQACLRTSMIFPRLTPLLCLVGY